MESNSSIFLTASLPLLAFATSAHAGTDARQAINPEVAPAPVSPWEFTGQATVACRVFESPNAFVDVFASARNYGMWVDICRRNGLGPDTIVLERVSQAVKKEIVALAEAAAVLKVVQLRESVDSTLQSEVDQAQKKSTRLTSNSPAAGSTRSPTIFRPKPRTTSSGSIPSSFPAPSSLSSP